MAVLYRKYRPQTFSEVLNQKAVIQTLKNQVASGQIAHAYLFTGSRGVGKTSVARILAKAVNCRGVESGKWKVARLDSQARQESPGDACGECEVCKQIEAGHFLDLAEIDAASNTGVDNIRELIEHVKFAPSLGKYKVFIIDEVHMLSKGAFNALLKTLEEPPAHAIFILATTEINKVPPTIISRTQRFDFKALSAADILEHLEKISKQENVNLDGEILELVARNAEGSVRDALSLLDKLMTLGAGATLEDSQQLLGITDIAVCENLLELIFSGDAAKIPDFFTELEQKGLDYLIFTRDFLEFLRKVLVHKVTDGNQGFGLSQEHGDKLKDLAEKFLVSDLVFMLRLFLKAYKDLAGAPSPQIPLLIASIEACLKKAENGKRLMPAPKPETEKYPDLKIQGPASHANIAQQAQSQQPGKIQIVAAEESQINMDEALELWPKVISKTKQINGPLASLLKNSNLIAVEGNKIVLSVKFNFDRQSLESSKNAALLSGIMESLCGKRIGFLGRVIKQDPGNAISATMALGEALKVFGGELID